MAGDAPEDDADLHPSPVAPVEAAGCRLCRDDEVRLDALFLDHVLPAHAVAVLFHDSEGEQDRVLTAIAELLEDPSGRDHRSGAALLVG